MKGKNSRGIENLKLGLGLLSNRDARSLTAADIRRDLYIYIYCVAFPKPELALAAHMFLALAQNALSFD